jgi:alginate O-acetyltransferase complex protein AlgI
MVFSSITFLFIYLTITLLVYYAIPGRFNVARNTFLLVSGLIFYAWGEPIYVFVMILSTLIDYGAGLLMNRFDDKPKIRRLALLLSVVMNLSLLGVFKYSGFIITNANGLFGLNLHNPNLPLPIGISFFTFQSMSYTIDLYLRNIKVQKNPMTFAAFVTLFPQIVAGPIVRYNDVAAELEHRVVNLDLIYEGVIRFTVGLGKKVLIANNVGALWSLVQYSGEMSVATAWVGILAFTLQIYFDFSGYSDMAIGLGKMLGFNFPENFNYPYLSRSISEFWRRWHMTLGAWFKSYVYFPLGGSRKGMARTVLNLGIVWLLTGIWHGASWNFIVWGSFYGVLIIIEKLFFGKVLKKLPSGISWFYTMFCVIIGWALFSAVDLGGAADFLGNMFGTNGNQLFDNQTLYLLMNYGIILIIGVVGSTRFVPWLCGKCSKWFALPVSAGIFLLSIAYLVDASYNPFLYFNF